MKRKLGRVVLTKPRRLNALCVVVFHANFPCFARFSTYLVYFIDCRKHSVLFFAAVCSERVC